MAAGRAARRPANANTREAILNLRDCTALVGRVLGSRPPPILFLSSPLPFCPPSAPPPSPVLSDPARSSGREAPVAGGALTGTRQPGRAPEAPGDACPCHATLPHPSDRPRPSDHWLAFQSRPNRSRVLSKTLAARLQGRVGCVVRDGVRI